VKFQKRYTVSWKGRWNILNNLTGVIGIAYKAGRIRFGSEQAIEAVRSARHIPLACVAVDASDNTKKRVSDSCKSHGVEYLELPISKEELGKCIGKKMDVSAFAVTDENFRKAIHKQLEKISASGDRKSAGGAIHGSNEN
jgi:ribosomal protein L7Ae-like RNA K-turn-binding protein